MKYLVLILVFLGLSAFADYRPVGGGNGTTWPFGLEQPFPWRGIQGVWSAQIDGSKRVFVFQLLSSKGDEPKLKITEFDAVTCELMSQGTGFERSRVLTAGMANGDGPFLVQVRAFRPTDVQRLRGAREVISSTGAPVLAISLADWNKPQVRSTYALRKISPVPSFICE